MISALLARRTWIGVGVIALSVAVAFTEWIWPTFHWPKPTAYVEYIGRFRPGSVVDDILVSALTKHLKQLNDSIAGLRFELRIRSIYTDSLRGASQGGRYQAADRSSDSGRCTYDAKAPSACFYNEAIADPSVGLVIDNSWFGALTASGGLIRENSLPVISTNSDRGDNPVFGPTVIFLGHDDETPARVAGYADSIVKQRAILIAENGYWLSEHVRDSLAARGRLRDTIFVERSESEAETRAHLGARLDILPGQFFVLNVHSPKADSIIKYLDSHFSSSTILGGTFIVSGQTKGAILHKGSTNDLIVLTPNPADGLLSRVAFDLRRFRMKDPVFAAPNAPEYVRRSLDAVSIMRLALASDSSYRRGPRNHRAAKARFIFRSFFRDSVPSKVLTTSDDRYQFDAASRVKRDVVFTTYHSGAEPRSVKLSPSGARVPTIRCGLDVRSVDDVDFQHNTFRAVFDYWFDAPAMLDPDTLVQFANLIERNDSAVVESKIYERDGQKVMYKARRMTGVFHAKYDLANYPLDEQKLDIELAVIKPADAVNIAFDEIPDRVPDFQIPAWRYGSPYVSVDNVFSRGLFGLPYLPEVKEFKKLTIHFDVERRIWQPFVFVILPLGMIAIAALAILHVRDLSFDQIGEVSAAVFLSIVAYSIAYYEVTPKSDQLTKADQLFGVTSLIVLGTFLAVIAMNSELASKWPVWASRWGWLRHFPHVKWLLVAIWVVAVVVIPLS